MPSGHIVNEDTAKQMLLSETKLCPTCRNPFYNYQSLHEYAQLVQLLFSNYTILRNEQEAANNTITSKITEWFFK